MNFIDYAAVYGLIINRVESGRWVRVPTEDKPRSRNGAYFFDGDYGHVQNWATMPDCETWQTDKLQTPTDKAALFLRMEASKKRQAAERAKAQKNAAAKAQAIIKESRLEKHAYLDGKGFRETRGLVHRVGENNLLVIPMRVNNEIVGCQTIDRDSNKKFLYGQRCAGAEYVIGAQGVDVYCEGYATGLSIHAALAAIKTPSKIHVCFSANNMRDIAKTSGRGLIVADNDLSKTGELAAQATGLAYFLPPEGDFNDYHKAEGLFKVSMSLRNFMLQAKK